MREAPVLLAEDGRLSTFSTLFHLARARRTMQGTHRNFRHVSTVMHIAMCIVAASCSRVPERGAPASPEFRVALLTPGPISDHAWNAGAYAGLLRIRDSLGARVSNIETKSPADFEENFRQYGAQGYDLVFGHGFEFQDAASRVGPDFPKTVFITTSGSRVRE